MGLFDFLKPNDKTELENLKRENVKLIDENFTLKKNLEKIISINDNLNLDIVKKDNIIEILESKINSKDSKISELNQKIEPLENDLKQINSINDNLKLNISKQNDEIKKLKSTINTRESRILELTQEIEPLQNNLKIINSINNNLKFENSNLKNELKIKKSENNNFINTLNNLKLELNQKNNEIKKLNSIINDNKNKISENIKEETDKPKNKSNTTKTSLDKKPYPYNELNNKTISNIKKFDKTTETIYKTITSRLYDKSKSYSINDLEKTFIKECILQFQNNELSPEDIWLFDSDNVALDVFYINRSYECNYIGKISLQNKKTFIEIPKTDSNNKEFYASYHNLTLDEYINHIKYWIEYIKNHKVQNKISSNSNNNISSSATDQNKVEDVKHSKEEQSKHMENINSFDYKNIDYSLADNTPLTYVEQIFLEYIANKEVINTSIAAYWTYEYNIDYKKTITKFLFQNYISILEVYENLSVLKVSELKDILDKAGMKKTGKKEELINRIKNSIPKGQLKQYVGIKRPIFSLTKKGKDLISNLKNTNI